MRPFYLFKPIMNNLFESLSYAIPTVGDAANLLI